MNENVVETLKNNLNKVVGYMNQNKINSSWIKKILKGNIYIEKKYTIPDFTLKENDDYKMVDFENSVTLYESLKNLPSHVLYDEKFWAWINFDKCYVQALQAMPVTDKVSTVRDHYFFNSGSRRSLFFGVMSRCYLRVALSVDERLDDKYELTKFVIENPERIRNLTWRSFSNKKHLVLAVLKAEKDSYDEYGDIMPSSIYKEIAKYVSKIGSVRLIDSISEEDMYSMVKKKISKLILELEDKN
jgi:hypothetical protein